MGKDPDVDLDKFFSEINAETNVLETSGLKKIAESLTYYFVDDVIYDLDVIKKFDKEIYCVR